MKARHSIESLLQEFYGRELGYLKQTLNLSEKTKDEEAARLAAHRLKDFLAGHEIPEGLEKALAKMDIKAKLAGEEVYGHEKVEMMEADWPETFVAFGKWIREHGLYNYVNDIEYPTWDLYDGCQMLRSQWLVSFVHSASDTAKNGFQDGYEENNIGYGETHDGPGYNIAYCQRDTRSSLTKARHDRNSQAVIFRAPGIRTENTGANIKQVLFWGPDAQDIVPVCNVNGHWEVSDWESDRVIFSHEDLEEVVDWVAANFPQYRKALLP